MQQLLIPETRAKLLRDKKFASSISKRLGCKIKLVGENTVEINGDGYAEYNAHSVLQAFGKGFGIESAYMLLSEEYFFKSIDIKDFFKSDDQARRVKARIIGREGKTKNYIEQVSGAQLIIYNNSVSLIGTIDELRIAETGINALINGDTHKKAYRLMENARKGIM